MSSSPSRSDVRQARRSRRARLHSKPGGFLVECVLDTGQRLHSDPFGEFDVDAALRLALDLLKRTMVSSVVILRTGTGEVVFDRASLVERAKHLVPLAKIVAPKDRILLPRHPFGCDCVECEHFRGEHGS